MEAKATVTLEIDPARNAFRLNFSGQLRLIGLGTVGATAGRFVLETPQTADQLGRASGASPRSRRTSPRSSSTASTCSPRARCRSTHRRDADRDADAAGPRRGRRGPQPHVHAAPVLVRPRGRRPAQAAPAGHDADLLVAQGGFSINISPEKFELYVTASLSFGYRRRAAQLRRGDRPAHHPDRRHAGPQRRASPACSPSAAPRASASRTSARCSRSTARSKVMFNTTRQDQTFTDPGELPAAAQAGRPDTINIFASAPGLDGQRDPNAPPGGEIYVQASDRGHDHDRRRHHARPASSGSKRPAAAPTRAWRSPARSARRSRYIGSLTGTLNLNIYAGATKTGVVGRIFLARSDAGSHPGRQPHRPDPAGDQHVRERADDRDVQDQEARRSDGVEFFDGFDLDAQNRLKVVTGHDRRHRAASRSSWPAT